MRLEDTLTEVAQTLERGKKYIEAGRITKFQSDTERVREDLASVEKDRDTLRLGIIGQMKAGKSSFLNAVLFDGQQYLPKAVTPMTAALTVLRYSETPSAKVVFLSEKDWRDGICKFADQYTAHLDEDYERYLREIEEKQKSRNNGWGRGFGMAPNRGRWQKSQMEDREESVPKPMTKEEFERQHKQDMAEVEISCKEVYDMAKERLSDRELHSILREGERKVALGNDYMRALEEYVGASGKYTPLVKYTELSLNLEALRGIDVVDTPGMNDPIRSRESVTREFLGRCDAVFILSNCGQFLGEEEISLLVNTLPDEGISHAVLIGTRMDTAILEYPGTGYTFEDAYCGTRDNCEAQARETLSRCRDVEAVRNMADITPICTSSMAYTLARKLERRERLTKEEQFALNNLNGLPGFDESMLYDLSAIGDVRDGVLSDVRREKNAIIEKLKQDKRGAEQGKFLKLLEDISIQVRENQKKLESEDADSLQARLTASREALDSARGSVSSIFAHAANHARRETADLVQEIRSEIQNHQRIDKETKTHTEDKSYTTGAWFWKQFHPKTVTIRTDTAQVRSARNNIRNYLTASCKLINGAMREMIDLEGLQKNVKAAVQNAFDLNDRAFNQDEILRPLTEALDSITIPEIETDDDHYFSILDENLTGVAVGDTLTNESIPILERAQDEVLTKAMKDLCDQMKDHGAAVANELEYQSGVFIDKISATIKENHKKLERLIQDQARSLAEMDQFLKEIGEAKQKIQRAE